MPGKSSTIGNVHEDGRFVKRRKHVPGIEPAASGQGGQASGTMQDEEDDEDDVDDEDDEDLGLLDASACAEVFASSPPHRQEDVAPAQERIQKRAPSTCVSFGHVPAQQGSLFESLQKWERSQRCARNSILWYRAQLTSVNPFLKGQALLCADTTSLSVFVEAVRHCNMTRRSRLIDRFGVMHTYVGVEHRKVDPDLSAFYKEQGLYAKEPSSFWQSRLGEVDGARPSPTGRYNDLRQSTACSLVIAMGKQINGAVTFHFAETVHEGVVCYISLLARRQEEEYKGGGHVLWEELMHYLKSILYDTRVYVLTCSTGYEYRRVDGEMKCLASSTLPGAKSFWANLLFDDLNAAYLGSQLILTNPALFGDPNCKFLCGEMTV